MPSLLEEPHPNGSLRELLGHFYLVGLNCISRAHKYRNTGEGTAANRLILEMPIQSEKVEEFVGMCKGALKDTRNFDGCQHLDWWIADDGSGRVLFHEVWESKAHQERYMAWRTETGFLDALGPLLAGAPTATWLNDHQWDS